MSYLFYIDFDKNVVLRPDAARLCKELAVIGEDELLFIILAYDNFSPFRKFPEEDRKRKAMVQVWGESRTEIFNKQIIKDAIYAYQSLQYDQRVDTINDYRSSIDTIRQQMREDKDGSSLVLTKRIEAISKLNKAINELEAEVTNTVIQKGQIKGNQELSFVEELMKNQKYFNSVVQKK